MAAESLQRRGRHREALELMSRLPLPANASPELAKAFGKLRATSEQTLAKSLADPTKFEVESDGLIVRRKPHKWLKTKLALAAAATIAVAYSGYALYLGASRQAFLVNGTDVAYAVSVDGLAYQLAPREVRPIRVSEGDVALAISSAGYTGAAKTTFTVNTPFWRRPFDGRTHVLNPDGLAAILTRTVSYGPASAHAHDEPTLYVGEVGHLLPDVDYAFTNPPASVKTRSGEATPTYTVAFADDKALPGPILAELGERRDVARISRVARLALAWPVTDAADVDRIAAALGPAETIAALAPRAALRQIEREAHRAYQDLRERVGEQEAVRREYAALLAADPNNGLLAYLAGRTRDDDREAALALYRRAQAATPPEPMAYVGEAYVHAARAAFGEALVAAHAARVAMPAAARTREMEWDLLMANRRPAEALALLDEVAPSAETATDFRHRLETLVALGRASGEVDGILHRRKSLLASRYGDEGAELDARINRMMLAYLRHNERGYADTCPVDVVPELRFSAAICRRDLAAAEKLLAEDPDGTSALLLFLAADAVGDRDVAGRSLAKAIELGRDGPQAMRTMSAWLAGEGVPGEAEVLDWPASPAGKRVALAALAAARPSLRPVCAPLIERLDYSGLFPHELVAASLAKHR